MAARSDHSRHQSSQRSQDAVTSWKSASGTRFATKRGAQWEIAASTRGSLSKSGSERREVAGRIALAGACPVLKSLGQPVELRVGQAAIDGGDILLEPLLLLGAGNGDDVFALRQEPGERHLRFAHAM